MLSWRRESEEKAGADLQERLGPQETKGDVDQGAATGVAEDHVCYACRCRSARAEQAADVHPQLQRRRFGREFSFRRIAHQASQAVVLVTKKCSSSSSRHPTHRQTLHLSNSSDRPFIFFKAPPPRNECHMIATAMATASLIADSTQISQGAEAVSNPPCVAEWETYNDRAESLQSLHSHIR